MHVVYIIVYSFSLIGSFPSYACVRTCLFAHLLMDTWVACFEPSYTGTVSIYVQVFVQIYALLLLFFWLNAQEWNTWIICYQVYINFIRNSQIIYQVCVILHPFQQCMRVLVPPILVNSYLSFKILATLWVYIVSHSGF